MEQRMEAGSRFAGAPWHLWLVGSVSLVWNAFGAYDYTMSQMRDADYLAATMGPMGVTAAEASAWLDAFPLWATALWAIGIWGSVLGSVLLLVRSRWAVWSFAASFVGAGINFAYESSMEQLPQMSGNPMARVMPLIILAAIALQWWYARRQTATGVLR